MNSSALFDVLSFLELSDVLQITIDESLELVEGNGSRKARKKREE